MFLVLRFGKIPRRFTDKGRHVDWIQGIHSMDNHSFFIHRNDKVCLCASLIFTNDML